MPLNQILTKCKSGYSPIWLQKINHLNVDGRQQTVCQNEKELQNLLQMVKIYSQDIEMEFGIEKCAMVIVKSGKQQMTDGMEQPNQVKIRTLGEYWEYWKLIIFTQPLRSGRIWHKVNF